MLGTLLALSVVLAFVNGTLDARAAWTDDALVKLYRELPRDEAATSPRLLDAVRHLKLPDEKRPKQFFDAIASYYDDNRGVPFPAKKLDQAIEQTTRSYVSLLRESQTAAGQQQELASVLRVKTWKLLQKLELFSSEMKRQHLSAWSYARFSLPPAADLWDKEHTIASAEGFKKAVCEGSKSKPVLVKFGSTQCADCMLMEYVQTVHTLAEKTKDSMDVYKVWWGPGSSKELDEIRQTEGVKSSPSFVLYRNGMRYPCGYQFPDDAGGGLENCSLEMTTGVSGGSCGS